MRRFLPSAEYTLLAMFCLVLAVSFWWFIPSVRAESAPLWGPVAADFTVQVEENNYTPPKNAGEHCTYRNFTLSVFHRSGYFGGEYKDKTYNSCARDYDFGTIASERRILQLQGTNKPYHLDGVGGQFVHVPGSNSLFMEGGSLVAYDDPLNSFKLTDYGYDGYENVYLRKHDVTPRLLRDSNGDYVQLDEVDASSNGEWLIVDKGSGNRFLRVDPDTFELLTFPGGVSQYNPYSDHNIDMAISNDGRYAAIAGGYNVTFKIYDLSTCVPDPDWNLSAASGCDPKDSRETLNRLGSKLGGRVNYVKHLQFSEDSSRLFATVGVVLPSGEWETKRVSLVASGTESSQPDFDYLALGDSFSSGEGDLEGDDYYVPGTDGTEEYPEEKCHLSKRSYPYRIANAIPLITEGKGRNFASVACSGAKMSDIKNNSVSYNGSFNQFKNVDRSKVNDLKGEALNNFTAGRAAQIEFVKKYKPKAITVGIGGNDFNFAAKLQACVNALNRLDTCDFASADLPEEGEDLQALFDDFKRTYEKLKTASGGQTKIYAVGYPDFINSEVEICRSSNVLLNRAERRYMDEGISYLNDVIEHAANAAGVTYVDIEDALAGKELCSAPQPFVYANGARLGNDQPVLAQLKLIGNESFHPNPIGHAAIAATVVEEIGNPVTYQPCPLVLKSYPYCPDETVAVPPIPEYFGKSQPGYVAKKARDITSSVARGAKKAIDVSIQGLKSATSATLWIESKRVELGTYTVGTNGELNASVKLPESIKPGYHTIHVQGTDPSGEPVHYYQFVLVTGPDNDIDGDGTNNQNDKCLFVPPSNVDRDEDGIDDACDRYVTGVKQFALPPKPTINASEPINSNNQTQFSISGTGKQASTAHITIDDTNPDTKAVKSKAQLEDTQYSKKLDVSSLHDGAITVKVRLENKYGKGAWSSETATKDTKAPNTEVSVSPKASQNGWHKGAVTVSIDASDNGTGIKHITYSSKGAQASEQRTITQAKTTFKVSSEGSMTITYFATDKAGNVAPKQTRLIRIDKTAPSTRIEQSHYNVIIPELGMSISGTATDQQSGVLRTEVTLENMFTGSRHKLSVQCKSKCKSPHTNWSVIPANTPTGYYAITAHSTDNAGNQAPPTPSKRIIVLRLHWWFW